MGLRDFIFFDYADKVLFTRNDAESATWQVDELLLNANFPFDEKKKITQGMRIAFEDDDGVLQPFEVRKVRNYPIDSYQEITAEHIIISELTDIHTGEAELTNVTPESALSSVLAYQPQTIQGAARWSVGNVSATDTSSGDIGMGSVWQFIRSIETNWNVYINPRVTWNASGITGRYLDIVPASGVFHGLRLSIDKNTDELGVTVDDTEVKTALFGYGGTDYTITQNQLDKTSQKITLVGYTGALPQGASINATAGYIEDTAATALYGRNGIPRFGFYQNGDITDQITLAQKTWDALQATNKPIVEVDCMVKDLYRLGYHDEKIRLHDTVFIDLLPMHDDLQLEIIKLSVDLLDPTATRPTIGQYIPNIVYIQRRTAEAATGGAGRSMSGSRGETTAEKKWSEFIAEWNVNNAIFTYHAYHIDHDDKVLQAAGLDIDSQGAIIYATDNVNQIGSKFNVHSDQISLVVSTTADPQTPYKVNAASIVAGINNDTGTGQSYVTIDADRVKLSGGSSGVTLDDKIDIDSNSYVVIHGNTIIYGSSSDSVSMVNGDITAQSINIAAGEELTFYGSGLSASTSINQATAKTIVTGFGTVTESSGQITIPYSTIAHPTAGDSGQNINFNIAATQFYIDAVAAAIAEGESHYTSVGRVYKRYNTPYYFSPVSGLCEIRNYIFVKTHPSTETPTGSWLSIVSTEQQADYTYYQVRSVSNTYVSGTSGTAYYTSAGYSDDYYVYNPSP